MATQQKNTREILVIFKRITHGIVVKSQMSKVETSKMPKK